MRERKQKRPKRHEPNEPPLYLNILMKIMWSLRAEASFNIRGRNFVPSDREAIGPVTAVFRPPSEKRDWAQKTIQQAATLPQELPDISFNTLVPFICVSSQYFAFVYARTSRRQQTMLASGSGCENELPEHVPECFGWKCTSTSTCVLTFPEPDSVPVGAP